jgi:thiosulfate/3-mercaptopyruvate sulfurtransferase
VTIAFDGPLVSDAWIREQAAGDLTLVDVRWEPQGDARAMFERGHLPGAVFLDVDEDLAAAPGDGPGRHPLPSPEAFARTMGRVGIGDDTPVVVYDTERGSLAARLWWMLDVVGHPVALLDGGMQAWKGALETGPGRKTAASGFTSRPWPVARIVEVETVRVALRERTSVVVDARSGERYRGEVEPFYAVAGHIPGARNLPWADMHDRRSGRFLSADRLRDRFRAAGVTDGGRVVAHCGSGVTACTDLLAMRVAGLDDGRLYVGSWSDWIADPDRPVALGTEPGTPA